jgi:hypothetical protein
MDAACDDTPTKRRDIMMCDDDLCNLEACIDPTRTRGTARNAPIHVQMIFFLLR